MDVQPHKFAITPWLNVRDSLRALSFYKEAFGAVEAYRLDFPGGVIARLSINGAEFWIGGESPPDGNFSPEELRGSTVRMILSVRDPDAVFNRAVKAGARVVYPVGESHGWRLGRVADPYGHHWEIGYQLA